MTNPKQYSKLLVTQCYLNGKSMDQIVSETGISKGKVQYLISGWKDEIGIPDIEDLREFSVTVRKSGISIGQCVQGFRMINILKKLGINEGDGNRGDNDIGNKYDGDYNEFQSFVEDIYKNCKREGVTPSIIPMWVKDLFDFYSSSLKDEKESCFSLNDEPGADFDNNMDNNESGNMQPTSIAKRFDKSIPKDSRQESSPSFRSQQEDDDVGDGDPSTTSYGKENSTNVKPKQNSLSPSLNNEIEIPFVSQISLYLHQKKKEYSKIEKHRKKVRVEVEDLEFQKALMEKVVDELIAEKKGLVSYFQTFLELKKVLLDAYGIDIDEAIRELAKIINDFKENDYDARKIIEEYTNSQSLKWLISENEKKVKDLQKQRNSLLSEVSSLGSQASMHRQTMSVYRELETMGFGLSEIKQIWDIILEIAGTRKDSMSSQDAVSLFIRDIEENYHDKFLLEDSVKEKRNELFQLKQEVNNSRRVLQLTPFVGTTLHYLFQHGISESDIISISQLVTETANGKLQLDPHGEDSKGRTDKDKNAVNVSNSNNNNNNNNRAEHWKSFLENLRKLGSINSSIKEQQKTLEILRKETGDLNKQKQDLSSQCQTALSSIGLVARQIHLVNWLVDYYYNTAAKKIKASSTTSSPLLVNLVYVNLDNQYKDDKAKDEKK